jgi:PAS domain S-box-containing protein
MPVNDTVMQGAAFITGIENTPTRILVRVHLARPVHQLVRTSLFSIALVTGVLTGILVLAIRWPLKKYVVDPLVSIDAALAEIGSSGDIFRTVPVSGDDEIRSLAASLNQMLDEIRSGQGKIRESEARFRTLIENTPDIVLSLDCDGRFTYVSPQVEQYGYSAAHLFGQSAFDLILPDDRESIRESFRHAMSEGRGDSAPFRILDPLQNVHWFEVKSTAIRDAAGQSTGLQAVIRDITERRRAMDAIALANKKLNLMYDITRHDILNKITVLFGLIDMTSASASAAERDEFLAGIRDAGQAIYRQILLTRDYQEVGVKSPRWLRLRDLVERATAGFSGHGVRFVMKTDGEEVFADPLIEKVIYNLADNAIRYGKTITTITFTSRAAGDVLELVCEDDGVGIEDSEKEKIFERGFGKNTGLGLFLTREILMITGITIREDGESGKGARFIITFPRGTFRSPGGDDRGPTNPAT